MLIEGVVFEGDVYARYFHRVLPNEVSPSVCVHCCCGAVGKLIGLKQDFANLLGGKWRCVVFKGVGKVSGQEEGEGKGVRVTEGGKGCDDREGIVWRVLFVGDSERVDDLTAV